jgi:hypothetical protein
MASVEGQGIAQVIHVPAHKVIILIFFLAMAYVEGQGIAKVIHVTMTLYTRSLL